MKDILKELEELNKKLNKFLSDKKDIKDIDNIEEVLRDTTKDILEKAFEKPAEIHVKKGLSGDTNIKLEGHPLTLLITLSALEKQMFEQFHVTDDVWEIFKKLTGIKESKDE